MTDYMDWPKLPDGRIKEIYIDETLNWPEYNNLIKKGYKITDVRLMPNHTPFEKKEVVQAYLIGMIEGTIVTGEEKRKYLELLAKTEGMLVSKNISGKLNLTCDSETLHELLKFGDSRHTLAPATDKEITEARLESTTPGAGKDDKICEDP